MPPRGVHVDPLGGVDAGPKREACPLLLIFIFLSASLSFSHSAFCSFPVAFLGQAGYPPGPASERVTL